MEALLRPENTKAVSDFAGGESGSGLAHPRQ